MHTSRMLPSMSTALAANYNERIILLDWGGTMVTAVRAAVRNFEPLASFCFTLLYINPEFKASVSLGIMNIDARSAGPL